MALFHEAGYQGTATSKELVAGIGLGVAFSALEAWRYPILGSTASTSGVSPNVCAIAVLALCCLYYTVVRRRLGRTNAVVMVVASLATASLFCYSRIQLGLDVPSLLEPLASFQMGFSVLLFMLWMEELLRMPNDDALATMVVGLIATFVIQAAVVLLDKSMAWGVCAILPLFSGLFYVLHRSMLQSVYGVLASDGLRRGQRRRAGFDTAQLHPLLPTLVVTLFCGIVFGLLNSAWRSTDLAATDPGFVQFNSAAGALVAAVVLVLVRGLVKRRGYIELLIVVFSLAALLMEKLVLAVPALFLIPLNVAQKLTFVMFLLAAQKPDDPPLRSLGFCGLFLVYRIGLFAQGSLVNLMADTLVAGRDNAGYVLTFVGSFAMVVVAVYELMSIRPEAPAVSSAQEGLEEKVAHYKEMAFNYYLAQKLELTQREANVMVLVAGDVPTDAIANDLCISRSTVKTHLHNIYAKVGVHSQKELVELIGRERADFFSPGSGSGS